jgi:predicted membrane protein
MLLFGGFKMNLFALVICSYFLVFIIQAIYVFIDYLITDKKKRTDEKNNDKVTNEKSENITH